MEKLTDYRRLTEHLFEEYERFASATCPGVELLLIFDETRDHYLLLHLGWSQGRRVHDLTLYVRLRHGKVWIEEDWTEDGIASKFLKGGVPKEDIILAYHPPEMRWLTESAVA
jgi:hypothetical protein